MHVELVFRVRIRSMYVFMIFRLAKLIITVENLIIIVI